MGVHGPSSSALELDRGTTPAVASAHELHTGGARLRKKPTTKAEEDKTAEEIKEDVDEVSWGKTPNGTGE